MEMLKKTNDAQEKKKVVINFGKVARGGGGIGTVILLGGALATAAFASAFIVRRKGRGSGNDSNRKANNPPPPVPAAGNKESEQDEANKRKQFTFLDTSLHVTKHPSSETRKEIEIKSDTQSLVLDEEPRIEMNGGPPVAACDRDTTQASEQIPGSINPKVPENSVISDGSVTNEGEFHLPVVDEKILPLEIENVKIESLKRDAIDEITEECNGFKEVNAGGEFRGDGEISEVKCEEAIEEIKEDVAEIGLKFGEEGIGGDQDIGNNGFIPETFVLESHCKDGQERILPVFDTPVIEHENVNGDKKQGFVSTEVVEIIHEDDITEEGEENQVKHIEEEIMPEKCEEENKDQQSEVNNEEKIPCQKIEENACIDKEGEENQVKHIEEEIMPEKCEEENKDQQSEVNNEEKIPCQKIEENACIDKEAEENQVKHIEEEIMPEKCEEENKDQQSEVNNEEKIPCQKIEENACIDKEGEENQVKHIEEEIMPEKCEEENKDQQSEVNNEEKIPCQKIEENACIDNPSPESMQVGDYDKDVQILTISTPEEEMIFHKDIEVSKEDAANEEEVICQQKNPEDEVEKNTEVEGLLSETINTGIAIAKDEKNASEDFVDEMVDNEDLSDEVEQNSEGTEDSSIEVGVVWPDKAIHESFIETQQMLINQEVEGKIEEDKTVKQGKHEDRQAKADKCISNKIIADGTHITANVTGNSAKTLFEKYVVDLATLKYYSTNSNTRRVLIATIPVLSSLLCSWFFGLSFDKLCLVVLLTIVLSKSMIID